jgi:hypothetical protein
MSDTGRYNFPAFAAKVIERCRELWPDGVFTQEGHSVKVVLPNAKEGAWSEVTMNIGRGYREYWASGNLTDVLDKLFSILTNPPITRAEIEQRAMIKFDHFKLNKDRSRIHWTFDANPLGVIITGVLDYPGNMHFFELEDDGTQPDLEKHGVSKEQLWEWGMAHLRDLAQTFTPQHLEFKDDWPGHELWVVANGSGYASAALLCPDIIDGWLPPALRGTWIAGIPDRDTLIIARPDTPPELLAMAMVNGRKTALYPFDFTVYTADKGKIVNVWGTMSEDEMQKRAQEMLRTLRKPGDTGEK